MTLLGGLDINGEKYQQNAHFRSHAWIAWILTDLGPINGRPKMELFARNLSLTNGSNVFKTSVLIIAYFLKRADSYEPAQFYL
jgi:hypothetical protein